MKIFLIGYRCTGKTTIGKKLAKHLDIAFVDTDEQVQQMEKSTIEDIVNRHGWERFRQLEQTALIRTLRFKDAVVSTGGGIILNADNRSRMRSNGFCIWLWASDSVILKRLMSDTDSMGMRPRLSGQDIKKETRQIMKEREPLYEQTRHMRIDTTETGVDECVNMISRRLKNVRL